MSHAPGLSGIPCSGHFSRAATRLSCTTSSATSKLPRTLTMAAVNRPASSRKTAASASVVELVIFRPLATAPIDQKAPNSSEIPRVWRKWHGTFRDRSAALRVVDDRPDLDGAGPLLGHGQRLVEVGDLDQREAANDLLGLDEGSVGDDDLAVAARDRGRGARPLELFAPHDLARPRVLLEPLARFPVVRQRLLAGRAR